MNIGDRCETGIKEFSRWQMSGLILGGIEIIWALSIEFLNSSIGKALDSYEMGGVFFYLMMTSGLLCLFGSVMNCRRFRMWGLAMTPFIMFPCALTMFSDGIYNTASVTMPWIGGIAVVVLWRDSSRKQRSEPITRMRKNESMAG